MAPELKLNGVYREILKKSIVKNTIHGDFIHSDFTPQNYWLDLTSALLETDCLNAAAELILEIHGGRMTAVARLCWSSSSVMLAARLAELSRKPLSLVLPNPDLPISDKMLPSSIKGYQPTEHDTTLLVNDICVTGRSLLYGCQVLAQTGGSVRCAVLIDLKRRNSPLLGERGWTVTDLYGAADILKEARIPESGIDSDLLKAQSARFAT